MSDGLLSIETTVFMVKCPNGCGPLTIIEKPISIGLLLNEEVTDLLPPLELEQFATLRAVCPKCGFVATEPPKQPEIQYDPPYRWDIKEPEEDISDFVNKGEEEKHERNNT